MTHTVQFVLLIRTIANVLKLIHNKQLYAG